jgi:hypothetical protein
MSLNPQLIGKNLIRNIGWLVCNKRMHVLLKQHCTYVYSGEVKERNQEEWAKESRILMII